MCELCSSEPELREKAKKHSLFMAEKLEALAQDYKDLAYGRAKPHSPKAKVIAARATSIVRNLVEEWV